MTAAPEEERTCLCGRRGEAGLRTCQAPTGLEPTLLAAPRFPPKTSVIWASACALDGLLLMVLPRRLALEVLVVLLPNTRTGCDPGILSPSDTAERVRILSAVSEYALVLLSPRPRVTLLLPPSCLLPLTVPLALALALALTLALALALASVPCVAELLSGFTRMPELSWSWL